MRVDFDKYKEWTSKESPTEAEFNQVLEKAKELKGLTLEEAAVLLRIEDHQQIQKLMDVASYVKKEIYGKRMVLFAPLYTGNVCCNNCLYCGFRKDNKELKRVVLTQDQISSQVQSILESGHKRLLIICGEEGKNTLPNIVKSIRTAYAVEYKGQHIRRINVEIAPLSVEEFKELKKEQIGTYICFQETYDPELYSHYHISGPKKDYQYRLDVMDRAMEAGIDDVGIGALFGLADYKAEVLSLLAHAEHLEKTFGCGPHTVSVPRIEPAPGTPFSEAVPFPVSDDDFRKIVAILRVALPYTGIILSTRESEQLRKELFAYGVSQISAGSKTNPGGYGKEDSSNDNQFSLGDHRSLEQVIENLVDQDFIPSFCTGCYRLGRVGNDFMDMAKPGLIKCFCLPNGMTSFAEYLHDFANKDLQKKGFDVIDRMMVDLPNSESVTHMKEALTKMEKGERDIYL
ncbi:[FeFe] hydrogenase H-cluster radical SAM maturase HydG [Spirochaeta cellobiosiphila]|uniref:[FeFe] hydrogenase H-cluster radical SAM maturase HydG n=1 Tax=Spirochaeta cellobiosiphila TaxID=504483 RepID=UPI000417E205|nr:[FeFe] hydrogenase H-cluster radical SAM maturase HydG [Spirochaeta cellobiosiphila]